MYQPHVNDYVKWDRHGLSDEGWIYFISQPTEDKKGFPITRRYLTIEVGVKKKPECQYDKKNPHNYVHILLLCYESQWEELTFVKKRKSLGMITQSYLNPKRVSTELRHIRIL